MRKTFLDNLPRWGEDSRFSGKINWNESIGYKIKFIYDDIEDEVEIVGIDENTNYKNLRLKLKYKDNEKFMNPGTIRSCRFGVLIGKQPEYLEFKHEINEVIKVKNGELKLTSKLILNGTKYYEYECLLCRNKDKIREYCLDNEQGCNVCQNKKVLIGHNDLWTTHPNIAKLLANKEDGYKITYGTKFKQMFKCPICGYETKKALSNVIKIGIACHICSDGLSYPTKIMINVLEHIGIDFKVEETFDWSNQKRYDFYIQSIDCIIEVHGEQHYVHSFNHSESRTLEEEQENDKYKEKLAKENGIKNYVAIDCRFSELDYIKNNILNSQLKNLLELSLVNWDKCNEYALDSMVKSVCDLWNDGFDSTTKISEVVKLSRTTIITYLKRGVEIGWCDYDPKEVLRKTSTETCKKKAINIVQISPDGNYIRTWNSASDVQRELSILSSKIGEVCKGKRKSAGGFVWMYKDDYEKRQEIIKPVEIGSLKEIAQLSLDGKFINYFKSMSEASRKTGVDVSNISKACINKRESCGFKWMFKKEYNEYMEL